MDNLIEFEIITEKPLWEKDPFGENIESLKIKIEGEELATLEVFDVHGIYNQSRKGFDLTVESLSEEHIRKLTDAILKVNPNYTSEMSEVPSMLKKVMTFYYVNASQCVPCDVKIKLISKGETIIRTTPYEFVFNYDGGQGDDQVVRFYKAENKVSVDMKIPDSVFTGETEEQHESS